MNTKNGPFYKHCLTEVFEKKRSKNARFSMRAFAKSINLNPGTLSQILSGKQPLSYKSARNIVNRLGLGEEIQKKFMQSVIDEKREQGIKKINSFFSELTVRKIPSKMMNSEIIKIIGDWYHPAIMEFTQVSGFKSDPDWIGKQLRISTETAKKALDRLLEFGIIAHDEAGKLKAQFHATSIPNTGPAVRVWIKQVLEKAIYSLENDPIESRTMLTWTIAIDPKKLAVADEMILEFNHKLFTFLEEGEKTHLYQLGAYLFPLQKVD